MLTSLHLLGPLWRACTNLYRSRPGGTAGLQIRRAEFDPLAACLVGVADDGRSWSRHLSTCAPQRSLGRWSRGKTSGCNPEDPRFDPGMALHSKVVSPTRCRTAATDSRGVSSTGRAPFLHVGGWGFESPAPHPMFQKSPETTIRARPRRLMFPSFNKEVLLVVSTAAPIIPRPTPRRGRVAQLVRARS